MSDDSAIPSDSPSSHHPADPTATIAGQQSLAYESRDLNSLREASSWRIVAAVLWLCIAALMLVYIAPVLQKFLVWPGEKTLESMAGVMLMIGLVAHAVTHGILGIGCLINHPLARRAAPAMALFCLAGAGMVTLGFLTRDLSQGLPISLDHFMELGSSVLFIASYGLLSYIHLRRDRDMPLPGNISRQTALHRDYTFRLLLALFAFHTHYFCFSSAQLGYESTDILLRETKFCIGGFCGLFSLLLATTLLLPGRRWLILSQAIVLYSICLLRIIFEPGMTKDLDEPIIPSLALGSIILLVAHVILFCRMTPQSQSSPGPTAQSSTESLPLALHAGHQSRWILIISASLWFLMSWIFLGHSSASLKAYRMFLDHDLQHNRTIAAGYRHPSYPTQPIETSQTLVILDYPLPSMVVGLALACLGLGLLLSKNWAFQLSRAILLPLAFLIAIGLIAWLNLAIRYRWYTRMPNNFDHLARINTPWTLLLLIAAQMILHCLKSPLRNRTCSRLPAFSRHLITWLILFSLLGFSLRVLLSPWLVSPWRQPPLPMILPLAQSLGHILGVLAIVLLFRNQRGGRWIALLTFLTWISYALIGWAYDSDLTLIPLLNGPLLFRRPHLWVS